MPFKQFLKAQLADFVETYAKNFHRTLTITILLTILCYVGAAVLLQFGEPTFSRQISILSYFFNRYSNNAEYNFIDLTKTLFIFLVAVFTLALSRIPQEETDSKEIKLQDFFGKLRFNDLAVLFGVLLAASALDFVLLQTDTYIATHAKSEAANKYISDVLFHFRIYFPLIMFSLAIWYLNGPDKIKLQFRNILFLYISLWLFNEFAYELSVWIRFHLFALILMPFQDPPIYYLFESILGIPLIAFYFLGYSSAMTLAMKRDELNHSSSLKNP